MALLREAATPALPTGDESWVHEAGAIVRRDPDAFSAAGDLFERARSCPSDLSVDAFLRQFDEDAATRAAAHDARAFVEGFEAADPALASARAIAEEWHSGTDSSSARPVAGYRAIFDHLARACAAAGARIERSMIVRRISRRRGKVEIEALDPSGAPRAFTANAAIVTVPVGVLRNVGGDDELVFDPPMPSEKRAALEHLEMGQVVKVAMRFHTPFRESVGGGRYRDAAFFRDEAGAYRAYWTQVPLRSDLVMAWAGGPRASALSEADADELIALALSGFGAIFGEPSLARATFAGARLHDWSRDPFSRGAYSYVRVGGANARENLAEPLDGTLFFAGEATATDGQGGTVSGALKTGKRAAAQVAEALGAAKPIG